MSRRRIVFLGNHDVGITALEAIAGNAELVGVVAHPEDPEDGVRYGSVFQWARSAGVEAVRGKASDPVIGRFIADRRPDLLWITDYRYLLPEHLIDLVGGHAVNLHPSLLPEYRGRAPINWAIIEGATEIGLTAHLVDAGVDTGDILLQKKIALSESEDVGDALTRLMPVYASMTHDVLAGWDDLLANRQPQPPQTTPPYPARKPADGEVDWRMPAGHIRNLVRAVAKPYPGAFSHHPQVGSVHFWKVASAKEPSGEAAPGTVLSCDREQLSVACGDGALRLSSWSDASGNNNPKLRPGSIFGPRKEQS